MVYAMKKLGTRLEALRGEKTQKEFAALCGIPLNTYTNWVRGICEPSASAIIKLCTTFGVQSDWLLGLSDARTMPKTAADAPRSFRSRPSVFDPNKALRDEIDALKRRVNALETSSQISTCA